MSYQIGAKATLRDFNFTNPDVSNKIAASTLSQATISDSQSISSRSVLRVTNSIAQYDVSSSNPKALANLGKALAGSLDRDDFTYFDPEINGERRLGDVLVSVDLSKLDEIVLMHRDSAGKGQLGRVFQSIDYVVKNPIHTAAMKFLGAVADPEVIYKQKVTQILAQLDREGLFGPPGASTFNLDDWAIATRNSWRDVIITRKSENESAINLNRISFGEYLRNSLSTQAA